MDYKKKKGEITGQVIIYLILIIIAFFTLFPLIYVFSRSISSVNALIDRSVWLWPKGFNLSGYKIIFSKPEVWRSYYNSIWYTVVGTSINVIITMTVSYPLSRKGFFLRNPIMFFIAFTSWFSGGIIPLFLLISKIGLYNTQWALVLPFAASVWNIIITRTYLQTTIDESLPESARIDGANDIIILCKIVLPLSKSIIAVNILFYAAFHWNSYFPALIYLTDKKLQPIQIYLRKVLLAMQQAEALDNSSMEDFVMAERLKYVVIVFSIIPMLLAYPFFQKYFEKGVMIGAIKG